MTWATQIRQDPQTLFGGNFDRLQLPAIIGDFTPARGVVGSDSVVKEFQARNNIRYQGYFPIYGFRAGFNDVCDAAGTIFQRVILNNNTILWDKVICEKDGPKHLGDKVHLNFSQKIYVVTRCITLFIRGLLTFCQLGITFAPFDALANRHYR